MTELELKLWKWLEDSLRFKWVDGAVTNVGSGHTTGWRTLPYTLLAQIVGGKGFLRQENGKRISITEGQALLVPARLKHCIDLTSPKTVSRWAHFSFVFMDSMDVLSLFHTPYLFDRRLGNFMGDICQELAELNQMALSQSFLIRMARRQELGLHLLQMILARSEMKTNGIQILDGAVRILPVVRYLETHRDVRVTLPSLAKLVHLSPSRFHHVFQEATGIAPMKFLQNMKLDQARELLASTDFKVSDIATRCGFGDSFHFSRLFKSRVGLSPFAFRVSLQKGRPFA